MVERQACFGGGLFAQVELARRQVDARPQVAGIGGQQGAVVLLGFPPQGLRLLRLAVVGQVGGACLERLGEVEVPRDGRRRFPRAPSDTR